MTKNECRALLEAGKTLGEIFRFRPGQECMMFKADRFQPGDEILYIPDVDLNDLPVDVDVREEPLAIIEVLSCCYTGDDFIEECSGNVTMAEELFHYCDWQHPSSALPELDE